MIDEIAEAAWPCPAVAGLHGGRVGQLTAYLPGRWVAGVTVSSEEILVGVVGCYSPGVTEIASHPGVRPPASAVRVCADMLLSLVTANGTRTR